MQQLAFIKTIRPLQFFIAVALCFELVLTVLVLPLQSPDEINHFYRTYQISEGHFLPEKTDQRLGGNMPYAFKKLVNPFMEAGGNEYYRCDYDNVRALFSVKVDANEREFQDFPNTSYYSPVSYLPQALMVAVLRQFDVSLGTLYYGGKTAAFIAWFFCMLLVIRLLPGHHWLFVVLLLLPMDLYVSNTYSADTITNSFSFLFIALVFRYAVPGKKISSRVILAFVTLAVLLALAKLIYVMLVFLLLIIPAANFNNSRRKWLSLLLIAGAGFLAAFAWSHTIMQSYYTSFGDYNPKYRLTAAVVEGADYHLQKQYILSHGTYFFKVLCKSPFSKVWYYLPSYIGGFGTYLYLFMPFWLVVLAFAGIVWVAVKDPQPLVFSWPQKLVLLAVALLTYVALLTSQHLSWNLVGYDTVDFIQGRYLIPIFPLLFLLFSNRRFAGKSGITTFAMALSVFLCLYAGYLMYRGFISDYSDSTFEIVCNTEIRDRDHKFTTSNSFIRLPCGQNQTELEHRSGKYSALLKPGDYCFTYQFKQFAFNDLVEVEVWQKQGKSVVVFTGKEQNGENFAIPYTSVAYREKDGWEKIHMVFSVRQHCDSAGAGFFIHNPGPSDLYIDDVKISIKKFKDNMKELLPH